MNSFIDISEKLESFSSVVNYLNFLLKQIEMPCDSQRKEKLIADFNKLEKSHQFSNFQLIDDNEHISSLFLMDKKNKPYRKRIPLYFDNKKIEIKKTLLIKKTMIEKGIEINYYFHLNSFYGFSIKCLNTFKYVGFSLNKNSFSCYFDEDYIPSEDEGNTKKDPTDLFLKAVALYNFFEDTNNQDFMSHIFKFIFEKKTISQQEIDNMLLIYDINFSNLFDESYIFDIPDDFYD